MKRLLLIGLLSLASVRGDSPLADAVQDADRERAKSLLAKHADVNAAQADGMTALHWAIHKDDSDTAKLLVKAGADINATNRYGISPISLACQNGNGPLVQMLLAAGADPNTRLRGGETILMTAARTGKTMPVKALIEKGADVNAKERKGQTAIMWATADGHTEVVNLLIKAGADFRAPLDGGFTPLFFAIREGRADTVKLLLKAGADINETMQPKRKAGRGPQAGMPPLLMAIENGHFQMAIELIDAGADPNDQRAGYTALHNVVWVRKPNHGEDEDGAPPPAGSGNLNSLQFVRELVSRGAKVNAKIEKGSGGRNVLSLNGATPFLMAAKTADIALLKLLLELGADPVTTNVEGDNAIIAAAGLGTPTADEVAGTEDEVLEVIDWLIKLGVDPNAVNRNGETALHGAAYKNLPRVIEFLAAHGAKIEIWNQPNKWNGTPLLIAEGFRPGNFKPSFETIAAVQKVMLASGITPPPPTSAQGVNNSEFAPKKYSAPAPASK